MALGRYLAPFSFAYNFLAQLYGILSSPSMKDIHDRNLSFWAPNPFFIGAFFFPQQIIQLIWLSRLWKLGGDERKSGREAEEAEKIKEYVPWYIVGNICIGSKSISILGLH